MKHLNPFTYMYFHVETHSVHQSMFRPAFYKSREGVEGYEIPFSNFCPSHPNPKISKSIRTCRESSLVLKTSLKEVWKKQRVFETPSVSISGVLTPIEGLEKFRQELTYAIFPNGKITPDVS